MRSQGQVSAAPAGSHSSRFGAGYFKKPHGPQAFHSLGLRWNLQPRKKQITRVERHFSYRPWKSDPARRSSNATAPSVSLRSRSARAQRAAQRWHAREYTHAQLAFDGLTTSRQEHQYGLPQMMRE